MTASEQTGAPRAESTMEPWKLEATEVASALETSAGVEQTVVMR